MNDEDLKHYFTQYWYHTNPAILMMDDLKNVLFKIFCEVEKTIPLAIGENRLSIIFDNYKRRILEGKKYYD